MTTTAEVRTWWSPTEAAKRSRPAAPGHVATVRRLFIDRLTPQQIRTVGDAAEAVLAALDAPPGAAPTTADGDRTALERPTTERT